MGRQHDTSSLCQEGRQGLQLLVKWVSVSDANAWEGIGWERALCLLPELRSKQHAVLCAAAEEVCSYWLVLPMVSRCYIFRPLTLSVMSSLTCQNHSRQSPTSELRSCCTLLTGTFLTCQLQLEATPASSDPSQALSTEHLPSLLGADSRA